VHAASDGSAAEFDRSSGWLELVVLFALSAVIATIIVITSAPANVAPGTTHTAVLVRGETSSVPCAEGVARVGSSTWVNDNDGLDRLRLPLRGHLRVLNEADAVFTAKGVEVSLAPAMPCTAG